MSVSENPAYFYMEIFRGIGVNVYVLIYPSVALERTISSFKLSTYEDVKHPMFIVFPIVIQWTLSVAIRVINSYAPGMLKRERNMSS